LHFHMFGSGDPYMYGLKVVIVNLKIEMIAAKRVCQGRDSYYFIIL
jgi:hypothetical protein